MKELDFNKKVIYEFADKVDQLHVHSYSDHHGFYDSRLYRSFEKGKADPFYLKKEGDEVAVKSHEHVERQGKKFVKKKKW